MHQEPQTPDGDTEDATLVRSRRSLFRRSLLGMTGISLAALLAACGDDDDDGEDEVETVESEGEDVVDEVEDEVDEEVDDEGN